MRKILAFMLAAVLVTGALTGCSGDSGEKAEPTAAVTGSMSEGTGKETEKTATVPAAESEKTVTPEPTEVPAETVTPEPTEAPAEEVTPEPGPTTVPINKLSSITEEDRSSELWRSTSELFMRFVEGEQWATGLNVLCDYFDETPFYSLTDIVSRYGRYLSNEMFSEVKLTNAGYALIRSAVANKPNLAVSLTFEDADGYDSPHYYVLVFTEKDGNLVFVTNVESYYRSEGILNDCGFYYYTGSFGADSYGQTYYYIDSDGENRFLYSLTGELGCSSPRIPNTYLPSDAGTLVNGEEDYTDEGYTVEIYNFETNDFPYEEYDNYKHSCYYTFFDPEGNPVMPDAEYLELCEAQNLKIASYEDIKKLAEDKCSEYGITEEIVNAPAIHDFTALDLASFIEE